MRVPQASVDSERPLRVLVITGNAIVGGMESAVLRLAERLPRPAFELIALCPFESMFTVALRACGVPVSIAPIGDRLRWHAIQYAAGLVREHDIDVIHAHLPAAHAVAALAGSVTHTPVLATIHAMHLAMRDLEAHRLGGTHLCVVSEAARAHALAVGVQAARLTVIRNGVDTQTFRPRTDGRAGNEVVVGYVGRLSPEKNPALFVRVVARLRAQRVPARFVVIGDGPMRGELEALAEALAVRDVVAFAGECRDMPARYRALDLLLLTSWHEGTPLALLEAMASGIPVVATDVGGVAELIVAGSTGCLAPPGDEARLAELALTLLQDRATLDRYGRAARERARTHFSIDEQVRRTAALLHEVARVAPRARTRAPLRPTLASGRGESAAAS
jgi:glycosyltransferase involved in cell wall biosynthesis